MDPETSERELLVASFRRDPPATSKDLASKLGRIWQSYPNDLKTSLKAKHGHWFFPDLPVLKGAAYTLSVLINAQRAGYDVTPCWEIWDLGLPPATIKTLLYKAKQQANFKKGKVFSAALEKVLVPKRRQLMRNPRVTLPEVASAAATTSRPSQQTTMKPSNLEVKTVATPKTSETRSDLVVLDPYYRRLINMRSAQLEMSPPNFMHYVLDQDAEKSGMAEVLAREGSVPQRPSNGALRRGRPPKGTTRSKESQSHNYSLKETTPKPAKIANGTTEVPVLTERLRIVVGDDNVGIDEAIERLKARGKKWIPDSRDLKAYISLMLSTHKDDFLRVSRGVYCVIPRGKAAAAETRARVERLQKQAELAKDRKGQTKVVENPFAPIEDP